ncbi:MAG TPA: hypothetical protein VL328_01790 [Gemmatimonadaceae bacterium]|nr:hypothetical protein [Gemmatimonadaceae bacterium]
MKGPPDQTVRVTFDPDADPQFTFDPESVRMTAAGKVILEQHPASPRWVFRDATVKDDTLHEFRPEVQGSGNALHIHDEFRDRTRKSYSYNVTVALGGTTVTSPDPVIVNDPGV